VRTSQRLVPLSPFWRARCCASSFLPPGYEGITHRNGRSVDLLCTGDNLGSRSNCWLSQSEAKPQSRSPAGSLIRYSAELRFFRSVIGASDRDALRIRSGSSKLRICDRRVSGLLLLVGAVVGIRQDVWWQSSSGDRRVVIGEADEQDVWH
jgi:hypothetical protein